MNNEAFTSPQPASTDDTFHSFNYSKHVPEHPKLCKPWDYAGMGVVSGIQRSLEYMSTTLIDGRDTEGRSLQIGTKFFVPSGTCDTTTSDLECAGKKRYLYFDTVPSNRVPCESATQPTDPDAKTTFPQGLLSGTVDDVVKMNPFELTASMLGKGSLVNDTCVKRTLPVGTVAPYGQTNLTYETRCTAPDMPLVCGIPGGENTPCIPYEPVPGMQPFNSIVRELVRRAATLVNPHVTPGTYPRTNDTQPLAPTPPHDLNKNDPLWRLLCTSVEKSLHLALAAEYTDNPPSTGSAGTAQLHTKGRCLVNKQPCQPDSEFGSGWYLYEWLALHGFANMPGSVGVHGGKGCSSITDANACSKGYNSKIYCAWNATGGCETVVPVVQVYWAAYINQSTQEVIINTSMFNSGIGNPPGSYHSLPSDEFSVFQSTSYGDDMFADYQMESCKDHIQQCSSQIKCPKTKNIPTIFQQHPVQTMWPLWMKYTWNRYNFLTLVLVLLVFALFVILLGIWMMRHHTLHRRKIR